MPSKRKVEKIFIQNDLEPFYEYHTFGKYRLALFSFRKNGQDINQDSLFVVGHDEALLLGVCDGAGGHPRGELASQKVANYMISHFEKFLKKELTEIELVEGANKEVLDLKVGAKTTLSMVHIVNDEFRCLSAGDSEILYLNSVGGEVYTNIPHSLVGYQVGAGLIDQEASLDNPERYLVDNLLGDKAVRIETTTKIEMKKGHSIIVGTDGLFDNLSHNDLSAIVTEGSFEESFMKLFDYCSLQNSDNWRKDDDISFIYLQKISV